MKTLVKDQKLFNELKNAEQTSEKLWNTLFDNNFNLKNSQIPILNGGLDHVEIKNTSYTFHDVGVSRGGKTLDNTFKIMGEK
jgi:hypothetical protein